MASAVSNSSVDHLLLAARWIEATLLGSVSTMIATIAIAVVGLGMLNGRIDLRRGVTVIIGCFVLFGAPVIADGLLRLTPERAAAIQPAPPPRPLPTPAPKPIAYDPYAGAAVPQAR